MTDKGKPSKSVAAKLVSHQKCVIGLLLIGRNEEDEKKVTGRKRLNQQRQPDGGLVPFREINYSSVMV